MNVDQIGRAGNNPGRDFRPWQFQDCQERARLFFLSPLPFLRAARREWWPMWVPLVGFFFSPFARIHRRRGLGWLGLAGLPARRRHLGGGKRRPGAVVSGRSCGAREQFRLRFTTRTRHLLPATASLAHQASKGHYRSSWHPCGT